MRQSLKLLVSSTATNEDDRRREFILNVLLLASISLAGLASLASLIDLVTSPTPTQTPTITVGILAVFSLLFFLAKHGQAKIVSYLLLFIYFIPSTLALFRWSIYLPQPLMIYALLIVMAGVLLSIRAAFTITLLAGLELVILGWLQNQGHYAVDITWTQGIQPTVTDAVVFSITLLVITVVSWLSNREIYKSLQRAHKSEAALKRERDFLEQRVEERTKELREAQAEQVVQLYRLAEVGKAATGLFHDLANPVTSVSLNLSKLQDELQSQKMMDTKVWLDRAVSSAKRLENFIGAARKQMQHREVKAEFSLTQEITQAIEVLNFKARQQKVKVLFIPPSQEITTYGNPVKFSQVIANLISNAIDAYDGQKTRDRRVEVRIVSQDSLVTICVQDWGSGISIKHLTQIFDPLFTTKTPDKGSGIGLAISQEIVENDFKGTITVTSNLGKGSEFYMTIQHETPPQTHAKSHAS